MSKILKNRTGSSAIEGLIWLPVLAVIVWGGVALLKLQYFRLRCAVLTFESVRKALEDRPEFHIEVRIQNTPHVVSGQGQCGPASESLALKKLSNERGSLALPAMLLTFTFTLASLGITTLHFKFQKEVQDQLGADQCVAEVSTALTRELNGIQKLNDRIQEVRVILSIPQPIPAITVAAKTTLYALAAQQALFAMTWKKDQLKWALKLGCTKDATLPFPLPNLPYSEQLPDSIGPRPMKLADAQTTEALPLTIHLKRHRRRSCAGISIEPSKKTWKQKWANNC